MSVSTIVRTITVVEPPRIMPPADTDITAPNISSPGSSPLSVDGSESAGPQPSPGTSSGTIHIVALNWLERLDRDSAPGSADLARRAVELWLSYNDVRAFRFPQGGFVIRFRHREDADALSAWLLSWSGD